MRLYTKDELIEAIREVSARGWHKSIKWNKIQNQAESLA